MALGAPKSAVEAYQQVINKGGNSLYAQMARLGLAEAQAQTGEYETAINAFRDLSQRKDGQLPVDGVLMRLGRAQADAGKASDAEQTFNRSCRSSRFAVRAPTRGKELDQLKKAPSDPPRRRGGAARGASIRPTCECRLANL